MNQRLLRACAIAAACSLTACGMHANPAAQLPNANTAYRQPMDILGGPSSMLLNVLLGDAAPDLGGPPLQRLDIGIKEIDAIENGQTTVLATFPRPRVVNVLAHQGNGGESVANADIPRSEYQQLRIVVDLASSTATFQGKPPVPVSFLVNVATSSSVGAGSTTLTTSDGPGAVDMLVTQPFSIPANATQAVRVDFNAFESLALGGPGAGPGPAPGPGAGPGAGPGPGQLLVRPSLFVAPYDEMGSIGGRILNSSGTPVSNATVVAVAPDGSIGNTSSTNERGRFRINTLRAGTYQLVIYNQYTTAAGRDVSASGQTNDAASISGPSVTVTGGKTTFTGALAD